MSRSKKSRKQGRLNPVKADKKAIFEEKPSRIRKQSGNKAGTRQQVANPKLDDQQDAEIRDPRIGSKKPIDLGIVNTLVKTEFKKKPLSQPSVAAIQVFDDTELLEQELLAIESNEELQALSERQDAGEELSTQETEFLATNLTRYQELVSKLDLSHGEDDGPADTDLDDDSDDALWDKLDGSDFSDFKE